MQRNLNRITELFLMVLFFSALSHLSDQLLANEISSNQKTVEIYPALSLSLGEEFILHTNQSAKIVNEDFEIKILQFYNSPCPPMVMCVWSGVGIAFEYSNEGKVVNGIDLVQAFGYQTVIIESDHETYAKLKLIKIK